VLKNSIYHERGIMNILTELWGFARERKKWWLFPVIVILMLVGALIFLGASAIAPFIYTIF